MQEGRTEAKEQKPVSLKFLLRFEGNPKIPTNPKKSFLVAGRRDERSEAKEQKPGSASSAALGIPESVTGCWPISIINLSILSISIINLEHIAGWMTYTELQVSLWEGPF